LYANGGWIKRTEIPPEYSRWGSFNQLIEHNNDALHAIAEKAAKTKADPKSAPEMQKVGDYYASGMDEKTIEAMRTKPLQDELGKIDNMKDRQDVLKEIAHLHLIGVNAFFNFGSSQDDKDSTREIAQAVQGGLGMPDRDYYTKTDDASKKLRDAYVAHVTKMLTLLGDSADKADADAKKIMDLETKLAEASRTRVELRDPQKNYNKMTPDEFQKLTPDWNWNDYFKGIGLTAPGDIDVHQPDFFKAVNTAFTSTSLADWIKTLEWMDEPTKKAALDKLAAFQVKIGYPEKWRDYSTLMVDRGPFVLNELRAENFEAKRELNKIGKPVDRKEWGMTPPTV